jgi:hypothetical protein
MGELINLALHAEDERVRSVCCVAVLDRAYGRPREAQDDTEHKHFADMSREEREAEANRLLTTARAIIAEAKAREAKAGSEGRTIAGEVGIISQQQIGRARDRSVTGD